MRKFIELARAHLHFVTIVGWSKWNEAWDQRLEPDRIEVSQPDRPDLTDI